MDSITQAKRLIQKSMHKFGWDIHQFNLNSNSSLQISKALDYFNINIIFDIGANTGQFSSELRAFSYKGEIVSFEPLSDAYLALTKNSTHDPSWKVHPRTAIGDLDGEITINISGNSQSSSVLPILEAHTSAAIDSTYIGSEKVAISRLDTISPTYLSSSSRLFIKIDTQGFEWNVLNGAEETLKHAQGILCELSLVPLYEGQRLWLDIIHRLEGEGFTLWSVNQGFIDYENGRTLQIDAIFFRLS